MHKAMLLLLAGLVLPWMLTWGCLGKAQDDDDDGGSRGNSGADAISEATFGAQLGEATCDLLKKCNRGYFDSEFSDMADCVDEFNDNWEELQNAVDDLNCDFNDSEAQKCLAEVRGIECEDWHENGLEDCEDIYEDCDGNGGYYYDYDD